jgi:HlyD family secretion protein
MTGQVKGVPVGDPVEPPSIAPSRYLFWAIALLVVAVIGWGAYGHWRRNVRASEAEQELVNFRPSVQVVTVQATASPVALTLPGTTAAFERAQIFARATGYIAERRVDIGSRVHAGDLLVRIAAPDLDQQLRQAVATLGLRQAALRQAVAGVSQAQSNEELAHVTNGRTSVLAREGWSTEQHADQTRLTLAAQSASVASAQAGVALAQANEEAQQATVHQLQELTGYEQVIAPFDGVVTARNVDVGDLINGTASGGTAMFVLERDDVLRVHIDVPQSAAVGLVDGLAAQVRLPEIPGQVFHGVVARNAASLAVESRTLPVEVDVRNDVHLLHPGLFVNVTLEIPRVSPGVIVPAAAILFSGEGLRVATVENDDMVKMHDVVIYRDFGTSVELREGLRGGERVVVNPPADLQDGARVHVRGAGQKVSGNGAPDDLN